MRDHLRALLVSLHLLAVFLLSLPAPAGMTRESLQEENLQSSFQAWAETAQRVGLDLESEDVQELSWTWGNRVLGVRKRHRPARKEPLPDWPSTGAEARRETARTAKETLSYFAAIHSVSAQVLALWLGVEHRRQRPPCLEAWGQAQSPAQSPVADPLQA